MKVLLGVICSDYIRAKTVATLASILKLYPEAQLMIKQGCYLHKNREEVALASITGGYDYLFFIDADMSFSAEVLTRFLEADKDIVGAHYNMRHFPLTSTMKMQDDDGNFIATTGEMLSEPFKVAALGTGCVLIKTSVFNKIERPWFWYGEPDKQIGEDVWFFLQAKKAGIDTYCHPGVQVGHEGSYVY